MELYEIRHKVFQSQSPYGWRNSVYTVVTATMDKDIAEKMLQIYLSNCSEGETYEINTVKEKIKENNND